MDSTAILVSLTVAAAVLFLVLALVGGSSTQTAATRQRLDTLVRGGPEPEISAAPEPIGSRVIGPAFKGAANALGGLLPKSLLAGVERNLITAGEPMTLTGFLTMLLISIGAAAGFGLMIVLVAASSFGLMQIGIIFGVSAVGFILPFWMVRSRAANRQGAIIKSLPDAFDLITTCVEAGLGLDAALARVAEKVEGPFAQELSRALREVALGKSRRDALKELGERTLVPDLVSFVNAVIQAEAMGSSVGQVLRVQSDQLRVRRRQRAEEAAYKAPVKMIFPLVLCIFPTLFIVILGPAGISIYQNLGH